ncbi:O-antigen ligase family protein [Arenibacter palladensis]|uniref:O-antigen ligase family protein n=1 Tax=Arenibacter palladensis TaxID=237373 RepID=UPI0026E4471C|nr:O-antigen ligase family protein [Arenibacter palladensis]MDO6604344.1 O-antigen ligase family protein [Arenibacter palladensis]
MNSLNFKNIQFYSILLLAVTITLPMLINNIVIIFNLAIAIIGLFLNKYIRLNSIQICLIILFITSLISIFYSCNFHEALKVLEKYLSFIVFPFIFSCVNLDNKEIHIIKYGFVFSVITVLLFSLGMAIYNSIENESIYILNPENLVLENQFRYHRLMTNANISATIFAMYIVFSVGIILNDSCLNISSIRYNKSLVLLIVTLCFSLYLMSSFTAYLALGATLTSILFFIKLPKIYYLLIILPIVFALLIFNIKAKGMDSHILKYNITDNIHNKNWNSLNIRLAKWECAIELIEDTFPIGTGVGCSQISLNNKYKEKGFEIGYNKKFSTHNQYLHYLVESGLLGLLAFINLLFIGLYQSYINQNYTLNVIFTLLIIFSLTDSVLIVNKGIVFFSFFICLASKIRNN